MARKRQPQGTPKARPRSTSLSDEDEALRVAMARAEAVEGAKPNASEVTRKALRFYARAYHPELLKEGK